ncbi:hypothetical protein U9M48_025090 [Paspalum notatum var. saurae]|uniref:hAT-like transposase RNase-H fold domain-containing protein n=1 Tax=Paspalum notatum var. saurae TaxID=547442 RepID=A0AAQ3TSU4_PASNO
MKNDYALEMLEHHITKNIKDNENKPTYLVRVRKHGNKDSRNWFNKPAYLVRNTPLLILSQALKYRRVFEFLRQVDPQYTHLPSHDEWKMAKKLCSMLQPFYDATKMDSGSKVNKVLEKQSSSSNSVISAMICIQVILDPWFKLQFLEFCLNEWFGEEAFNYLYEVKKTFLNLFVEYCSEYDPIQEKAHTVGALIYLQDWIRSDGRGSCARRP